MIFVEVAEGCKTERKTDEEEIKSPELQRIAPCFMAYIDKAHPDKHSYALLSPHACK